MDKESETDRKRTRQVDKLKWRVLSTSSCLKQFVHCREMKCLLNYWSWTV